MEKEFEYKGHKYWVKVERLIVHGDQTAYYVAYVNDERPGGIIYGKFVRDPQGLIQTFTTELSAVTNANLVKQSELDKK